MQASREVIVSVGTYQSPQLLMLSGIGPADQLPLFGIEVRKDLPVGQGLQDHCMTLMNWKTDIESLMTALTPENLELLQTEGRGPLSSNIAEAGGFMRTRPGLRCAGLPVPLRAGAVLRGRPGPSGRARHRVRPGRRQAHQPRLGHTSHAQPILEAAHPPQLPHDRRGPPDDLGGRADRPEYLPAAGAQARHHRRVHRPEARRRATRSCGSTSRTSQ